MSARQRASLLVLATVVLGGCHLLFGYGGGSPVESRDARAERGRDGGGWTQIVKLAAGASCPAPWLSNPTVGGCILGGKLACGSSNVASVQFAVAGSYSEIRGAVAGLQWFSTDAFNVLLASPTLDDVYVEGVSITVGSPRRHVYTFASGLTRKKASGACPCAGGEPAPAFVGSAYQCDSGNTESSWQRVWYTALPLWDGDATGGDCKPLASPGAFQVKLGSPAQGPIEVRIMFDSCDENVALTRLELAVR